MTQDEIIELAIQAGIPSTNVPSLAFGRVETGLELLEAFAKLVADKEREACAKVVEDSPSYDWHKFACETAFAIRARGQA
jgi:hypothetical protein